MFCESNNIAFGPFHAPEDHLSSLPLWEPGDKAGAGRRKRKTERMKWWHSRSRLNFACHHPSLQKECWDGERRYTRKYWAGTLPTDANRTIPKPCFNRILPHCHDTLHTEAATFTFTPISMQSCTIAKSSFSTALSSLVVAFVCVREEENVNEQTKRNEGCGSLHMCQHFIENQAYRNCRCKHGTQPCMCLCRQTLICIHQQLCACHG